MQFHLIFLKFIRYLKGLSEKVFKVRKTHNIRCAEPLILCVLLWEDLLPFLLKLGICPASVFGIAEKIMSCGEYL